MSVPYHPINIKSNELKNTSARHGIEVHELRVVAFRVAREPIAMELVAPICLSILDLDEGERCSVLQDLGVLKCLR